MKKLLYFIVLAGILINSCSKDELVLVNGIIHGYVKDYYNTKYISGAHIQYQINGDTLSVTSDSSGYFSITGLPPGDHYLIISHTGYLSEQVNAWIEPLYNTPTIKDGGKIDYVESVDANLPELNVRVSGTIKKSVGPDNIVQPASNVNISIELNSDYIPRVFTTTTNENGYFELENIPAAYVQIYIAPVDDVDNHYSTPYSSYEYFHPNDDYVYNTTLNRYDAGIFLTSTSLDAGNGIYRRDVAVDENIVLNFNINVSKDQTMTFGGIGLTAISFDPDADFTFSGSRITINPPTNLDPDADYTLAFIVYSDIPGDFTSAGINFHTAP
jgi:hypothetical protein